MKTTRAVGVGVAFVLAITFILRGQVTVTAIQAGTISLTGTDMAAFKSLSDAQLETLVNALEATPTVSADSLPRGGMAGIFYSLQHPDWPPLPGDISGSPVWNLGGGSFLLNDLAVNYAEPQLKSASVEAQAALAQARNGATLFRTGQLGGSMAGESQYWSLQNPLLNTNYASEMGMPGVTPNFIMGGTLNPGASVIANEAGCIRSKRRTRDTNRHSTGWCRQSLVPHAVVNR